MMSNFCKLCNRELDDTADRHHLIPKSKKGTDVVLLHRVCHDKIHSLFSEKELADYYNTIEILLTNDDIKTFVKWVKKKPMNFYPHTKMSKQHHKQRRKH